VRESALEKKCGKMAKEAGALWLKWSSPGLRGVPDRVLIYRGAVAFVELKAPGNKPTKLQAAIHRRLREAGANVHVIDNVDVFDELLSRLYIKGAVR